MKIVTLEPAESEDYILGIALDYVLLHYPTVSLQKQKRLLDTLAAELRKKVLQDGKVTLQVPDDVQSPS